MLILQNLIWTEGFYILAISLILTVLVYFLYKPLSIVGLLFIAFSFYFFRNPTRVCKEALQDTCVLICPADGKVVDIKTQEKAFDGFDQKISIFLSPFDVHVNWTPMAGVIIKSVHKPGQFMPAYVPKSSILNERHDIVLADNQDRTILVRQIAGTLARRIVCWINCGDSVFAGQKYGMIKFGSRVDILLPKEVRVAITLGQHVYGGQTVLGKWQC